MIVGRVEVGGGEVEQGVLLGEVEILHGAWDEGFAGNILGGELARARRAELLSTGQPRWAEWLEGWWTRAEA